MREKREHHPIIFKNTFDPGAALERLSGQAVGTWLIRESSTMPGMISISFVKEDETVGHSRFAFYNDTWNSCASEKEIEAYKNALLAGELKAEYIDSTNIKEKFMDLTNLLKKNGYQFDKLIKPEAGQYTSNPYFSRYKLFHDEPAPSSADNSPFDKQELENELLNTCKYRGPLAF